MRAASLALLALACGAAAPPAPEEPEVAPPGFEPAGPPMPFAPPEVLPAVSAPGLAESSGVAPSLLHPGTFWTLNDSGNPPELFRFDLEGHLLERRLVEGLTNRDWEDLASGPCPERDTPCLYIAEIGDNKRRYGHVAVFAVREPPPDAAPDQPAQRVAHWWARYPDGARNAETLLRDPGTGRLYLVTKEKSGASEVFRFPERPADEVGVLEKVADVAFPGESDEFRQATGGSWSADGRRVIVRTYMVAWEWDVDPAHPEAFWTEPPRRAWLALEQQGEGITYLPDGALLTTSEGEPMAVDVVRRSARIPP
ncbi:MAG: hypothetical protein ABIO70_16925 [Pseudomonadota bacterium]